MSPLCESFLTADSSTRWSRTSRCTLCLRPVLPGAAAGVREPRAHLQRVRVFLLLLDELGRACARLLRDDQGPAAAWARTAWSSSSPATTATCCSTSCRWACRCWASSRRPTSRRSRDGATCPTLVGVLRHALAERLVAEGKRADLIVGNNVLAQVPDLNDFVAGMKLLLAPEGVITLEFPHLQRLIDENQFDTIYHEHFSYFSLVTIERLAESHGLKLFDVEECRRTAARCASIWRTPPRARRPSPRVSELLEHEIESGFLEIETYARFAEQVRRTKRKLLAFLIACQGAGQAHLRLRRARQGQHAAQLLRHRHRLPRLHRRPQSLQARPLHARHAHSDLAGRGHRRGQPDYVLILPWNLKDEIVQQMRHVGDWGGKFVVPIPEVARHRAEPERALKVGRLGCATCSTPARSAVDISSTSACSPNPTAPRGTDRGTVAALASSLPSKLPKPSHPRKQAFVEQIAKRTWQPAVTASAFMNSSQLAPMSTGTTKVAVSIQI